MNCHLSLRRARRGGAIALIAIVTISAFALAIMTTLSFTSVQRFGSSSLASASERTFTAAEAGIQDALYRIGLNGATGSYSTTINGETVSLTIIPFQFNRTITAQATDTSTNIVRTITIKATASSIGGGGNGAVQTAGGGLQMDNRSVAIGNIHVGDATTPGNINSANNAKIYGHVWISGLTGLANNVTLANTVSPINATAAYFDLSSHTIKNSTISGEANYFQLQGSNTVHGIGTCTGNVHCHSGSPDPTPQEFPITVDEIKTMATQIDSTGNTISTCDVNGDYHITDTQPLPPVPTKINCNLVFDTNNPMTLRTNLWVTGDITFPPPIRKDFMVAHDYNWGILSHYFW